MYNSKSSSDSLSSPLAQFASESEGISRVWGTYLPDGHIRAPFAPSTSLTTQSGFVANVARSGRAKEWFEGDHLSSLITLVFTWTQMTHDDVSVSSVAIT